MPPRVEECIFAEMEKGDAFIMLASAYHGGGHNATKDERRLMFATFSVTRLGKFMVDLSLSSVGAASL